jgi:carbamoyl-phosphate synthase large subunit
MSVNTTEGQVAIADSAEIRRCALRYKVYCTTTLAGAEAVVKALQSEGLKTVRPIQDLHAQIK